MSAARQAESELSYLLRAWLVDCLDGTKTLPEACKALFGDDPQHIGKRLDELADDPVGPGSALIELAQESGAFE